MSKKNKDKKVQPEQENMTPSENEEIVEDINEVSEVDELKKQIDALKNDYARAYADTENLKKRLNAEAEQTRKYRIQSFAKEILPVIDNFERALQTEVVEADEGFKKGMELILKQLRSVLERAGVSEIEALGKEFDPNFHNAVMHEEDDSGQENIVTAELQKGYMYKDSLVRPSMVKVLN